MIRKLAVAAGALALMSGAAMAQGVDLGARAIVIDNYNNQRALQEQAGMHDLEPGMPVDAGTRPMTRISQREAVGIARQQGLDNVGRVQQTDGAWTIDGMSDDGEGMIVRVSRQGEVLDIQHL